MKIYFTDFFEISPKLLEQYGAFNISLINDLPLFIDPFLLFNSKKLEYQKLHAHIIKYVKFLRDKSADINLEKGLLQAWFYFPEVKQNWLGFSVSGNRGSGLRDDFAESLHKNLNKIFSGFGKERITTGSHLEKLCLIKGGVGRDKISDFTTNLIKNHLLEYTQKFAKQHLSRNLKKRVVINKVNFNYKTETWESKAFTLPYINGDYIILTPKNLLTRHDLWINKVDLIDDFEKIPDSIPDAQLRAQINNYFRALLPKDPANKDIIKARQETIHAFPQLLDYYIRYKERNGYKASASSSYKVKEAEIQYIKQIQSLAEELRNQSDFYNTTGKTYEEAMKRVKFLKDVIENKDGYKFLYHQGKSIENENDLQILYRLTWYATELDVNREVNNGRGPVDYKISKGGKDSTLIEFKLAKNSKLEMNLKNQVEIYKKANNTKSAIKVILYFNETEKIKVEEILRKLRIKRSPNIVLIDAIKDNKPSASKAKSMF
ncbi:MAG: hypothetical protein HS100_05065 [Anaerolineales bacterium]|nr:hypothetical protein [Anaerolineales bacterium]